MLTADAARGSGFACSPAVENQHVAGVAPAVLRQLRHKPLFDLRDVGFVGREAQAFAEALNVGVDHEAHVGLEGVAQHHVRRLAGHAPQREQFVHGARHLPVESLDDRRHRGVHGLGFVAEKADGLDEWLDIGGRGVRVVRGRGKSRE